MSMVNRPCEIHIIPGTHWDREWRHNFEETRQRLIEMLENAMQSLEADNRIPAFVLDGQFMPIKDYLEMRPENRKRIVDLVESGRLLIGPWYSLPDMVVTLGESTIRNLHYGIIRSRQFGGAMMEGMTNSSWGQISQMPQILQGFDINTFASYHGVPGHAYPVEFWWEGADGSKVLFIRSPSTTRAAFYLSVRKAIAPTPDQTDCIPAGSELLKNAYRITDSLSVDQTPLYGDDHACRPDYELLYKEFAEYAQRIKAEVTTPHILMGDLCDGQPLWPDIVDMVEHIKTRFPNDNVHLSTIPEYFGKVKSAIGTLTTYKGEMRFPHKEHFAFRLCNILATRLYLKQVNRQMEYLLTKWTEPFATIAWLTGASYPACELDGAWEMMFVNHAHDAIGGCSVDCVHDDMMCRYQQINHRCRALLHRSLGHLSKHIGSGKLAANESRLVVFNPLPFERSDVLEAYIDVPASVYEGGLKICDKNGNPVVCHVINGSMAKSVSLELPLIGCPAVPVRRLHVELEADKIPALGYAEYKAVSAPSEPHSGGRLKAGKNWMENDHLKAYIHADGTIDLLDKQSGQNFTGLHYFENCGMDRAARNSWYMIPPKNDVVITSKGRKADIKLSYSSPLQVKITVTYTLQIPKSLDLENVTVGRQEHFTTYRYEHRSKEMVDLQIVSTFTLGRDAKRLDVETRMINTALDHRLRVMFPTHINTDCSWADSPFDVVSRPIAKLKKGEWAELRDQGEVQTHPMLSFVDLATSARSMALIVDGLPEYDVLEDDSRTAALTLVRAILHGRLDPETVIPTFGGSQCLGPHKFRYALYPHQGNWEQGKVHQQAQSHNIPLMAVQCMGGGDGTFDPVQSFITFDSDGLEISAIKKSHNGEKLIIRLFNITTTPINTRMTVNGTTIRNACLTNMLEEPLPQGNLKVEQSRQVRLEVAPKKIVTVMLEPA